MNMSRLFKTLFFYLSVTVPSYAYAATGSSGSTGDGRLKNPLNANDLWALVGSVLDFIIRIGAVVIIFMVVYVGFLFVTARGDPAKLTTARQALLWTIVGALILLGAKAISIGVCETVKALSTSNVGCPIL
jgi:heme/copper-type cytochrome/quinol oxidase subunit 2